QQHPPPPGRTSPPLNPTTHTHPPTASSHTTLFKPHYTHTLFKPHVTHTHTFSSCRFAFIFDPVHLQTFRLWLSHPRVETHRHISCSITLHHPEQETHTHTHTYKIGRASC